MMKVKNVNKKYFNVFGGIVAIFFTSMFMVFIFMFILLMDIGDYFIYKNSVKTKEEMFQKFYEEQDEYQNLVMDMKEIFKDYGKEILLLNGKKEYEEYHINNRVLKDYPICMIAIEEENDNIIVTFEFKFCPQIYTYWGIYYSENGTPSTWGEGQLKYVNGIFEQEVKGAYKYETEEMSENWYYYQCWTR